MRIIETVVDVNDKRKKQMAEKIIAACGGSVAGKTLCILGLTFKPNTDDMRDSPSVSIIPVLEAAGAKIQAYDPEGTHEAKKMLPNITYCDDAYAAMKGAEALVLLTEWNQFRNLDLERTKSLLKSPVVVDLRNVYTPADMRAAGFTYTCVGRPKA